MASDYIDALKKSKVSDTKTILSPKRQIVENQKGRCFMCEKSLGNAMCYFADVQGPNMNTGINSKEMRAICPPCFFALGKEPIKQLKKTKDAEKEKTKAKEKKAEDEEEDLFKELKLKHNSKDDMYDQWD